jgi:Acyl-CoA dehydrogenase, C-terminal domain
MVVFSLTGAESAVAAGAVASYFSDGTSRIVLPASSEGAVKRKPNFRMRRGSPVERIENAICYSSRPLVLHPRHSTEFSVCGRCLFWSTQPNAGRLGVRNICSVNFAMDADVVGVVEAIAAFFERRGDARAVAEAAAGGSTAQRSRWAALCELGLPALRLPQPDGVGAALLETTAIAEKIGAVLLPEPAVSSIVLAETLRAHPRAASLVEDICSGRRVAALCGFDTVRLSAEGALQGLAYLPQDGLTELMGLLATDRHCGEPVLIMLDSAALPTPIGRLTADPTRPWAEIDLQGVEPVDVLRLRTESARRIRSQHVLLTVAELVGGMQKVLDDTVTYVSDREQFGRPIGSFQAVKHRLADMYVATEQARAAVQWAAIDCDRDAGTSAVASAARWVPRAAIDAFDSAIHLHGAMGYSWEIDIHLHLRRALATRHLLSRCDICAVSTPVPDCQVV